jgi:hypothetical protein
MTFERCGAPVGLSQPFDLHDVVHLRSAAVERKIPNELRSGTPTNAAAMLKAGTGEQARSGARQNGDGMIFVPGGTSSDPAQPHIRMQSVEGRRAPLRADYCRRYRPGRTSPGTG